MRMLADAARVAIVGSRTTSRGRPAPSSRASAGVAAGRQPVSLALSKPDAAAALGISINSFERHVQPHLPVVRLGKLRLFPVEELERWLRENSERLFAER